MRTLPVRVCNRASGRPHCSLSRPGGATATRRCVQELAGHAGLMTTQHYMHLSPAAVECRELLDIAPAPMFGDMLETEAESKAVVMER
jgi:hypothetical protein